MAEYQKVYRTIGEFGGLCLLFGLFFANISMFPKQHRTLALGLDEARKEYQAAVDTAWQLQRKDPDQMSSGFLQNRHSSMLSRR